MEDQSILETGMNAEMAYENHLAGAGLRLANFIIDRILFSGIILVIGYFSESLSLTEILLDLADNRLLDIVISLVLYAIFMYLQESLFKSSLGKLITNTKIISVSGEPLTNGQILGRSFSRIVPLEPFSFLGTYAVGWHDKWTETRVVKKSFLQEYTTEF